jgi:hypothetical protein
MELKWEIPAATTTRRAATVSPLSSFTVKPEWLRSMSVTIFCSSVGTNCCWNANPYSQNVSNDTGRPISA